MKNSSTLALTRGNSKILIVFPSIKKFKLLLCNCQGVGVFGEFDSLSFRTETIA